MNGTLVYKYHWRPTLKRLKLPPVRIHDCRHTAATLQLEAEIPVEIVSKNLEDASITITADILTST